ncbi:DUF1176 domain-containing protein [Methylocella silvestris]|uniref:DUF1176 domain-containing protein n=1 Tax=Methylocella silvestris TaxID=199596 RepID=UPI0015E0C608|nr:DUF1176 domain-containing protein [Methylocella silvestris]
MFETLIAPGAAQRRFSFILALTLASGSAPARAAEQTPAPQAQPLKQFKDWTVGCDNLRNCVALGLSSEADMSGAYVKISRTGAAEARPSVSVTLIADLKSKAPGLRLQFDGAASGLPDRPLPLRQDGDFVSVALPPEQVDAFLAALRTAKRLTIRLIDGKTAADPAFVSLAGSVAALLYMDAQQNRAGTVSALIDKGAAPSSTDTPEEPSIAAVKMTMDRTEPKRPAGVASATDESCKTYDPIVIRLSVTETLWGICDQAAAYNFAYRFWIAGPGRPKGARAVAFATPGHTAANPDSSVLVNPSLSENGLILSSSNKGRGIGDCGEAAGWAYDGAKFRLVSLQQMDECRGVAPGDWPTLYKARVEPK